jgi:hypothetical protein
VQSVRFQQLLWESKMGINWRVAAAGILAVLLGCQTTAKEELIAVRTDGQKMSGNPALVAQGDLDRTICFGEVQKVAGAADPIYYQGLAGAIGAAIIVGQKQKAYFDIYRGCMAQKGYVIVPIKEAPVVAEGFRKMRRGG